MNFCSVIIFVILGVSLSQGYKKVFCLSSVLTNEISCGGKELLYVTSETFGPANYNNQTCAVNMEYMSCIYKPLRLTKYLTTGSNCNGKTKCTIQKHDLTRILEQYLQNIQSMCNIYWNLTRENVALEVEYDCISDTLVHRGCNGTDITTSEKVYLLVKQIPSHCMCMAQGTRLTVRALFLQNDKNVFSLSDHSSQCRINGTQQYNDLITCKKNASTIHVKINNGQYQDNRMWLRFQGDGNKSLRCNESLTTPSIRSTEDSLKNYLKYIAVSVSVVIFLLCFVSIAICCYRRNKSNLNVKNLDKENRGEQRLYDYSDVTTLMYQTDNVHNQDTINRTVDYNHLTFSERQQCQGQEQNGNLYDTQADYNHLAFSGHSQQKQLNDINLYDTTSNAEYNMLKVEQVTVNANPKSADYDYAPTSKPQ